MFKLRTKETVSINRVKEISMSHDSIDSIDKIGIEDGKLDGIKFYNYHESIIVLNFLATAAEVNSNTTDKSSKHNRHIK